MRAPMPCINRGPTNDLKKKGLRLRLDRCPASESTNQRPEKEGIKTRNDCLHKTFLRTNQRPEKEGIKTSISSCISAISLTNQRPEKEGIKTGHAFGFQGADQDQPTT